MGQNKERDKEDIWKVVGDNFIFSQLLFLFMNLEREFIRNAISYFEEKGYIVIEHRHGVILLANEKELILAKAGLNPRHDEKWKKVMANKKIQIGIIEPRSDSDGKHINEPVLKLGYFPEG